MADPEALFAGLAVALGVDALPRDNNGGIRLTIGDDATVILFAEGERSILAVSPIAAMPRVPEYGVMVWLLRRNLYDSDLAPFQIGCDAGGNLILWGRVPVAGMTGAALAGLVDAVGSESGRIRAAIEG